MNFPCTYFDIYRWNQEIVKLQQKPVSIHDLLNDIPQKLTAFKTDNKLVFEMVISATETLNKKYFVVIIDVQGKETLSIGENGNPVFIEGKSEEEFKKELDALFTTKTSVKK